MSNVSLTNPLTHIINRQINPKSNIRVKLFDNRLEAAKNLYKKDLISHYGCVNAIEFSNDGELLVSGGDDRRVLLWKIRNALLGPANYKPAVMKETHHSNIFCLSFDSRNTRIYSGGNDDQVMIHDIETGAVRDVFVQERSIYGLSVDPQNDVVFCTAGDDGRILLYDCRTIDNVVVAKYHSQFHSVMFHPVENHLIVTANAKEGTALWDLRRVRRPVIRYGEVASQSCMSARFNGLGTQILVLRRRLPPILYGTMNPFSLCQFYHTEYYNSCTMKSCSFAGQYDQFVMSGSDDFNLYVWRLPTSEELAQKDQVVSKAHMVLYGHRSIVNQVRYNNNNCFIASSGVEKMIKLWSPFNLPDSTGSLLEEAIGNENARNPYTNDDYTQMMQVGGQFNLNHDYSSQSTTEDSVMMAFFDTLIQEDIAMWSADTTTCTSSSSNSDNSSSVHDSTDTEGSGRDDEQNFSINRRLAIASNNVNRPQRAGYPNRIAYLWAMKRSQLMRLAQKKRVAHSARRQRNRQAVVQGVKRRINRTSRSLTGRQAVWEQARNSNRPRRVRGSSFRHRCLQSRNKISTNQPSASSPDNLDVPSTSTGITETGRQILFRLLHDQDSDDDHSNNSSPSKSPVSPVRFVNIIPTPLNGSNEQMDVKTEIDNRAAMESNQQNTSNNNSHFFSGNSNSVTMNSNSVPDSNLIIEDNAPSSSVNSNSISGYKPRLKKRNSNEKRSGGNNNSNWLSYQHKIKMKKFKQSYIDSDSN